MREEQLRQYFELYTDVWKLFRNYCEIVTEEEWVAVFKKANKIKIKHQNTSEDLVSKMLTATLLEIQKNGK